MSNSINGNPSTASIYDNLGLTQKTGEPEKKNDEVLQGDFLKLMTTELMNQDPLKPMDNTQFLTQIAQFSQVSGINNLQTSFNSFATSMQSSRVLEASALVGKHVMTASNTSQLPADGEMIFGFEAPSAVNNVTAYIYAESGELVKRVELGDFDEGIQTVAWNGLLDNGTNAAPGRYEVSIEAGNSNNKEALETYSIVRVESVTLGKSDSDLELGVSDLGSIKLADVKQIM